MFQLYKITGQYTDHAYYGYCTADQEPFDAFLVQTKRNEAEIRGAKQLLIENNDDIDSIEVTQLEIFDNELDAFLERNEERARDPLSITGPSLFPAGVHERASKEFPERVKRALELQRLRDVKTAREAYICGAFNYKHIKELGAEHGKEMLVADLDNMTPVRFAEKYNLLFQI